jgi:signal transduction histidine kinase
MLIRRTARILAVSRALLAAVFLASVWLDPAEPARAVWLAYAMLIAYLVWSCVIAMIAWSSWWWDFRLVRLAHSLDIAVFIAAVFVTESAANDFSSPFIAFAAFLLTSATVRWGQRGVRLTALALFGAYAVAGCLIHALGISIDIYQFGRRLTYMVTLAIMMLWLSADKRIVRLKPIPEPGGIPGERRPQVIAGVLAYARRSFQARGAAIAVIRSEEPGAELFRDIDGQLVRERIGPGAPIVELALQIDAVLFDRPRQRRIVSAGDDRLAALTGEFACTMADACEATQGLLAGFNSVSSHGQLLIWGVPDACTDDLQVICLLSRELGVALDREEMTTLAQTIAVSKLRNALARDLHDSVAQFFAGTLFRLEALRHWIRDGHDPDPEILAMKDAFRSEQRHLRTMIDRLRRGIDGDRGTDIAADLDALMIEEAQHWQITTNLCAQTRPLVLPIGFAHELRLLVREAIANAVRHGACSHVDIAMGTCKDGLLTISIGDNGKGFPPAARIGRPRSISERIEALGGRMEISSCAAGARLEIELPLRMSSTMAGASDGCD